MKTVGETLKNQRLKINSTLEEISRKTRIQEKYLLCIEKNDFKNLPTATFVKGFIQNYAKAVGFDPKVALAIFRRDFSEDQVGRIIPRSLVAPIEKKLVISPNSLSIAFFGVISVIIGIIFIRQILLFYQGPEIAIVTPQDDQLVISPLEIKGTVSNTTELYINSQAIHFDQTGQFVTQIQLSPGDHSITISAKSQDGKTKIIQKHITVK